jgi:hypothetical protein
VLTVQLATIPYLQFGGHLLQNVPVDVLPPEGEDLGAWISPAAFQTRQADVDLLRLRLMIR